jgi:peptide subunit release factor 1 (eRF1)
MLDRLLGRASLQEEIADLQEELRHAERQLEAEGRRRSEAVRERQAAEERVNRLEDRIADLEGRLDGRDAGEADLDFRRETAVRGDRLRAVLDRLDSFETEPEGALTAMFDDVPDPVREVFGDRAALVSRAAPCLAVTDDAGLVSAALAPPDPPEPFVAWADGFEVEREWFLPTGEFVFVLVRSDIFALGEYDGDERTAFEGFSSDVKSNHSKGGFSQGRFERRRDDQIDAHLDRCREAIESRDADRLYVAGERTVLGEFADEAVRTATVDATGDPEDALDSAFRDFWTTRLYGL